MGRAARALTAALAREADWAVQAHVLRALPGLLQARALALGRRAQDLDLLAATLCALLAERRPSLSEVHAAALPALAALASYNAYLEPQTQQRIVRCLLKYGMGNVTRPLTSLLIPLKQSKKFKLIKTYVKLIQLK